MRDPKRIRRIMTLLTQAWECCPDLRLGQLILNIQVEDNLFYIEDNKLEEKIKDYIKRME